MSDTVVTPAEIGARIKSVREDMGIHQSDLAAAVGVTQSTFSRYESGDVAMSAAIFFKIAFELGEVPTDLWYGLS